MFTIRFRIFDQDFKYFSFLPEDDIVFCLQQMFNEHHMTQLTISNSTEKERSSLYSVVSVVNGRFGVKRVSSRWQLMRNRRVKNWRFYDFDREVIFLENELKKLDNSIELVRIQLVHKKWLEV